jgi:deoxyribodipyrimidine photolyase
MTQQAKFDPTGEYVNKWLNGRAPIKKIIDYEKERNAAFALYVR